MENFKRTLLKGIITLIIFGCAGIESYKYDTKYISVPVDHFSFVSNVTYKLRYLINDTYWEPSKGPIFFYTGNEGDVITFAENTGFMWEIAPEFQALIVFAEHRYYGESMPFGNASYDLKNIGYLTSTQALADFVDVINFLQTSNKEHTRISNPVIAFGGSYGGMLSAYLRMKYPFAVAGAIASSAPIFQFEGITPCGLFSRIVTTDFKTALNSSACANNIRNSWAEIRKVTANDSGKEWFSNQWKFCDAIKTQTDVDNFIAWLVEVFGNLAMINYPYSANFLAPVPAFPVRAVCSKLNNSTLSGKDLVVALQEAINVYTNYTGQTKCIKTTETSPSLGETGWNYQACTEMVMPMCSDGVNDMFEKQPWNPKEYSDQCYKKFEVRPQLNLVKSEYGGKNIQFASNIVFSNGLLDPWSAGGVLQNASKSIYAILIPEGAHHLDLRETNPADPQSVIQVRKFHKQAIQGWIKQHYLSKQSKRY